MKETVKCLMSGRELDETMTMVDNGSYDHAKGMYTGVKVECPRCGRTIGVANGGRQADRFWIRAHTYTREARVPAAVRHPGPAAHDTQSIAEGNW